MTMESAGTKTCPYCAETIQAAAIKCKHCGERLDGAGSAAQAAQVSGIRSTMAAPTKAGIELQTGLNVIVAYFVASLPMLEFHWAATLRKSWREAGHYALYTTADSYQRGLLFTLIFAGIAVLPLAVLFSVLLKHAAREGWRKILIPGAIVATTGTCYGLYTIAISALWNWDVEDPASLAAVMFVPATCAVLAGFFSAKRIPAHP